MALNFPAKIYQILENESTDIICWHANGNAFRIVDHDRFEREIIPKYFRHNQLSSVQRQLNLYGFKCVSRGDDKGAFFHPKFRKGEWEVVKTITRFVTNKKGIDEINSVNADKSSTSSKSNGSPVVINPSYGQYPSISLIQPSLSAPATSQVQSFRAPYDLFAMYEPAAQMFHHMIPTAEPHMAWHSWNQMQGGSFPMTSSYSATMSNVKASDNQPQHAGHGEFDFPYNFDMNQPHQVDNIQFDADEHSPTSSEGKVSVEVATEPIDIKAYPRTDKQSAIEHIRKSQDIDSLDKAVKPFVYVINEAVTIDPDFDLNDDFALFRDTDLMPPSFQSLSKHVSTCDAATNTDSELLICSTCSSKLK